MHRDTWVIEVTEFNSEVSLELKGHLEATRVSEAMKVAFRSNLHMDSRVIEVAGVKYEFQIELCRTRTLVYRAIVLLFLELL